MINSISRPPDFYASDNKRYSPYPGASTGGVGLWRKRQYILSTKIDAKLFLIIKLYEHKNYSYMYACSALWLKKSRLKTWIYYSKCQYGQFHPSYISWTIKLESRQVWSAIHWIYYLQGFFLSLRSYTAPIK